MFVYGRIFSVANFCVQSSNFTCKCAIDTNNPMRRYREQCKKESCKTIRRDTAKKEKNPTTNDLCSPGGVGWSEVRSSSFRTLVNTNGMKPIVFSSNRIEPIAAKVLIAA